MKPISILKAAAFAAALIPAAALAYRFYRFFYSQDITALPANPGDYITDQTAHGACTAVITLTVPGPSVLLTKWKTSSRCAACWGCARLFYARAHAEWVVFCEHFDVTSMIADVLRSYITAAWRPPILLALSVSRPFRAAQSGRRWQMLHRLVYAAAIGAVIHFWWQVKADITLPRRWAVAVALLLAFRVWWAWRSKTPPARSRPARPHQLPL